VAVGVGVLSRLDAVANGGPLIVHAGPIEDEFATRARLTYDAMQAKLYVANGDGLYRETTAAESAVAYLWPFSRAYLATLCMAGMPSGAIYKAAVPDRAKGLARYWNGSAYASAVLPPGGDIYYDDNAWVALSLILQYRLGLSGDLNRPKQLFTWAKNGWDRVTSDPMPGGVFWVQQGKGYGLSNHDRGAGASAGSAELGFHLHELTRSSSYSGNGVVSANVSPNQLGATNMVNWVAKYLDRSGTGSGPFQNVVRRDGSIDTNIWSYNQGVMLGARVLQHRLATRSNDKASFLKAAEGIARQALATFGDFTNHPPSFNAMCFQNMLMLHAATADATLKANMLSAMRQYADWAWSTARDSQNLFYFDDGGRPMVGAQDARVQDQGAMTQLFALLAWNAVDYGKLT
jgi:hypothetical protein